MTESTEDPLAAVIGTLTDDQLNLLIGTPAGLLRRALRAEVDARNAIGAP